MAAESAYLRYLPPALWEGATGSVTLGQWLRIFEKLLSGIEDGIAVDHGDHQHPGIEQVIGRLSRLFHPWTTPPDFLDWLASWVGLPLEPQWSEHQSREILSRIVELYGQRGTRHGFLAFLALYLLGDQKPRIVIDEGGRLFFSPLGTTRVSPVHSLASQVHAKTGAGLGGPISIAAAPDGTLFVVDLMNLFLVSLQQVYRISRAGEYLDWDGVAPAPLRMPPGEHAPSAVAVDLAAPYGVWIAGAVRSDPNANGLFRTAAPGFAVAQPIATFAQLGTTLPVAMHFDPKAPSHLLILDRGAPIVAQTRLFQPAKPAVIDVELNTQTFSVVSVKRHDLTKVVEPLSMVLCTDGTLLIGDGADQATGDPGGLVRVTRGQSFTEEVLTQGLNAATNPLIAPVGIVQEDASRFLVLDSGLRPFSLFIDFVRLLLDPAYNPFLHPTAEQPTVYRVDVSGQPRFARAIEGGQLAVPSALAATHGNLYIGDLGLNTFVLFAFAGMDFPVVSFVGSRMAVAVHFSQQRPTTRKERLATLSSVERVLNREKPAHITSLVISRAASISEASGWETLAGSIHRPIVGTNADGRLEVFAKGLDGALWHIWQLAPGGPWSSWHSLGGQLSTNVSNFAVANNADGRLEVFAFGSDDALWHIWQVAPNNGWSGWHSLGGSISTHSSYVAVERNADGRLEVFVHGSDNALWHIWQVAPNGTWGSWVSLGGSLSRYHGNIAAARNADGRLEVFVQWDNDFVRHVAQTAPNGNWGTWSELSGQYLSTIGITMCAAVNTNGRMELFARAHDNALWHNQQTASSSGSWTGWSSLGSVLSSGTNSGIAVVQNLDGRLEVFMQGDRQIFHMQQTAPGGPWGTFEPLGGSPMVGVAAAVNQDGRLEIFINAANTLWHRWQTAAGNGWVEG
jgi:hypothetical protein